MEAVIAARYMAYQSLFSTSELGITGPERLAAVRNWPESATQIAGGVAGWQTRAWLSPSSSSLPDTKYTGVKMQVSCKPQASGPQLTGSLCHRGRQALALLVGAVFKKPTSQLPAVIAQAIATNAACTFSPASPSIVAII